MIKTIKKNFIEKNKIYNTMISQSTLDNLI